MDAEMYGYKNMKYEKTMEDEKQSTEGMGYDRVLFENVYSLRAQLKYQ